MTTDLLGKAGKKLFEKHLEKYSPPDPMYEQWTDERGKKHRRKRDAPPGLSKRDRNILLSVNKRAHYLDKGFSILGFHFGWTFIIGFIPGAGDVVDATLNYFLVVRKCRQADIPSWLLRRMLMNNAVSIMLGIIPFLGDVFLAVFKANSRNAALLEEFLRIRGEEYLKLKAKGKDPEAVTKQLEKGKGKETESEKRTEVAKGVDEGDVEQVKPGAGKEAGEVIPGREPTATTSAIANEKTAAASGSDTVGRTKSFLSGWRKKGGYVGGEKGKFVENLGSSSDK